MPVLRRFAFPTKPVAVVIALAAAGAGGRVLAPRLSAQPNGIAVVRTSVHSPVGPVPVVSVRVSLTDPVPAWCRWWPVSRCPGWMRWRP